MGRGDSFLPITGLSSPGREPQGQQGLPFLYAAVFSTKPSPCRSPPGTFCPRRARGAGHPSGSCKSGLEAYF